jgi:hypothetical protein
LSVAEIIEKRINKWLFWRVGASGPWYLLGAAILNAIAGREVLPWTIWLLFTPAVTVCYFLWRKWYWWLTGFLPYTIVFPGVLLCLLIGHTPWASKNLKRGINWTFRPATGFFGSIAVLFLLFLEAVP